MAIDFNTDPYYDDFNESNQFYRILFKPGRAVQARELTQLQTLLQKQIERFGKNIFKEGSLVLPGSKFLDTKYRYVKLTSNQSLNSTIIGQTLTGQTYGATAVVLNFKESEDSDDPTIFVKYLTSGTGITGGVRAFIDGEELRNSENSIIITAAAAGASGTGTAFNISSGVIFVKGNFVYFDDQTLILKKYSTVYNLIVGFDVTESLVTSDDDETLLDPALSSSNYLAPGADRYKIELTLNTRELTSTSADDPNFVELLRIENGGITKSLEVQYNILNDTLARRTYDESGDYVVKPFKLELVEHLRESNVQASLAVLRDGLYEANANGNSSLFVSVVSQGKAYVKGFEIDTLSTRYVNFLKARDSIEITNGTISTPIGNYIEITSLYGVPDITNIASVSLRDGYTSTNGSPSGNQVGTARVRGIEYSSGTVGTTTSEYRLYLFDISVNTGKSFERNVKQIYFDNSSTPDFTANIVPSLTSLSGTATTTTGNSLLIGIGTLFTSEVVAGDVITLGTVNLTVSTVTDDTTITLAAAATSNITGLIPSLQTASVVDATIGSYIFPLPYNIIKTVDDNNVDTTYKTRRSFARTLSANATTLTAGTGETFSSFSSDNYQLVFTSGGTAGQYLKLLSSNVTLGGGSTTVTINIPGYASNDVYIIATINKSASAADRKIKTLVTGEVVNFTTSTTATASSLSLGFADVYQLSNIIMSANAFGSPFYTIGSSDITSRYTLDTGQKATFYDVGKVKLKPGQPKATAPVRITFDYFTHGTGDFFSVKSYNDIDYEDIPSFTTGGKTISLRDALDFRPRINNAGTGFTGTGAVLNEFLDHEDGLVTDYEYYLPRIDKLVLDSSGNFSVTEGVSSLDPKEPRTPDDSMPLYVLNQKAYVFDIEKDIDVKFIDNRRYTMRDIGKIDNRVKNLEYYTQLSLLERDTEKFQIKDSQGFDRFKNSFVVDPFKGHGVGDPTNEDYAVAIDSKRQEARPLTSTKNFTLRETSTTTAQRDSNNYVLVGDIITLPYTDKVIVENSKASIEVNLNPFNIVNYVGTLSLTPAVDNWFDFKKLPAVFKNQQGNYDTLVADAKSKSNWGTVWGAWNIIGEETFKDSAGDTIKKTVQKQTATTYSVVEVIDTVTYNDVVQSTSVVPKMRDVNINFKGEGLKPNTLTFAFFDENDVTNYCRANVYSSGFLGNALFGLNAASSSMGNLITDSKGMIEGSFFYQADIFNLNNGLKNFKLVDSSFNGQDFEMIAEATFTAGGQLKNIANEIVSTRNARIDSSQSYNEKVDNILIATAPVPSPVTPITIVAVDSVSMQPVITSSPVISVGGLVTTTETTVVGVSVTPTIPITPTPTPVVVTVTVPVVVTVKDKPPLDFIDLVYTTIFGRQADAGGKAYWKEVANTYYGINTETIQDMTAVPVGGGTLPASGVVDPRNDFVYNSSAEAVFKLTSDIDRKSVV